MAEETITPSNSQQDNVDLELKEYRNENGEFDIEKLKKLEADKTYYRQQLSKIKQLPQDKADYGKDFVLDSKFNEYVADEANKAGITELFDKIDNLSVEKEINVERNHDIKRFVLDTLVDKGVIDLTSADEKAKARAEILSARNEKIQEYIGSATDREGWDIQLDKWLKDFCNSDTEYQAHKKLIETNATWAMSLDKVRHALSGNKIPVVDSDPNYNAEEWQRAFVKADVETQNKMLEERAKKLTKGM